MGQRKRRLYVGGLALGLALTTACGDGDSTGPRIEFDPEPTTDLIVEALTPFYANQNLLLGLTGVEYAVASNTGQVVVAPQRAVTALESRAARLPLRSAERSPWRTLVTFPSSIAGETLVFSTEDGEYHVDEEATGAPAGGVRVTHYTVDQFGFPTIPLEVRGYVDLTDETTAGHNRVGVHAVSTTGETESTLADYYVGVAGSGDQSAGEIEVTAVGDITGDGTTVDFDLSEAFEWSEAQDLDALDVSYQLDPPGQGTVEFALLAEGPFEEQYEMLQLTVTAQDGGETVVMDFDLNGFAVDGEISVNGTTMVLISGQETNPTFEWADDREMTNAERAGLLELWEESIQLLNLPFYLFTPGDVLFYLDP